jgi:hypothetical protein
MVTLIANSLTNVVKTIVAGTGTAVSVTGNTVTIWTTATGGIANLTNLSSDITFSAVGVGAPTFVTTSTGTKISYYQQESATTVDYATGIEPGGLWTSIPSATSNYAFKWYGGTSTIATLTGTGTFSAAKFVGDGSSLTNITVNQQANIVGVQPNVTLVAGNYSYVFDNTGTFTMPANGDIVMPGSGAILSVGGPALLGGASQIVGYYSSLGIKYAGSSTQYGLTLQPAADNTNAITFLNAGGTNIGSITQTTSTVMFNMNNRPAFRVYGAGTTNNLGTTINTNGILNSNNFAVDYNQGSYLNTSTGYFTAPIAGLYSVHLNARVVNNTTGTAQVIVIKNYGQGSAANQVMWETPVNAQVNHFGVSTISKLAAGDTLVAKITVGFINFDINDSWSVAYIG